MKTILDAVRALCAQCDFLSDFTNGENVDWSAGEAGSYGIFPTGESVVEGSETMDGCVQWHYSFVLQALCFGVTDAERIENSAFCERLANWIYAKNRTGITLPQGCELVRIYAGGGQFVDWDDATQTGTYRIQCGIFYEKEQ
ncbi:MAG: hypothetical protein GXZ14_00840 [Ruminococcaceae bacterium]|nr:hypothetical protein [Oscillospiraceae bacterium]